MNSGYWIEQCRSGGKNRNGTGEGEVQDEEGQKKVWQMNIKIKKTEMWKLILRLAQTNIFII